MHGTFPTHNKYYIATEIFPFLTKKEIKDVFYPPKTKKPAPTQRVKRQEETED